MLIIDNFKKLTLVLKTCIYTKFIAKTMSNKVVNILAAISKNKNLIMRFI